MSAARSSGNISYIYFQVIEWAKSIDAFKFYSEGMLGIDEFFNFCYFTDFEINCRDIVEIVPTLYGLCYQLNSKKFPNEVFRRPGHRFGLAVQVNIKEFEYGGQAASMGVGAKVK